MRSIFNTAVVLILCAGGMQAQPAPQTARQALIEMFFSKTPGTLVKHLPAATVAVLEKSGALTSMQQYSAMLTQMQSQGRSVQTYETGSVLLATEDPKTGQKMEMIVENDSLQGDQDDIEISFQGLKDGQAQPIPFKFRLTFSMKQEAQVWKLNEIAVTVRVPLTDPLLLKAITEKAKQPAAAALTPQSQTSTQTAGNDPMVLQAMRSILTAEVTYAATYPNVGFTCTLSDLDGFGGGQPNEHQAMLIHSGLASGKRYGYVFSLSGCSSALTNSFHLTATPGANMFGRKTYCADQSAVIRSSNDGNGASCMASGAPVQ